MANKIVGFRKSYHTLEDKQAISPLKTLVSQFDMLNKLNEDFFGQKFFCKKMLDLFYKQLNEDSIEKIV